ncbi:MAG: winged helix-turn-helix transcriptional regulator [Pseudolabrys sp.]
MPGATSYRSSCPLASALDIVGDKWSLIIIRGFFVGFSRYGDFLKGPEPIATNILADRLQMLECVGLIERVVKNSPRSPYRLTAKGADLLPVLQELSDWGYHHIADRWRPPEWFVKAKPKDFYPKNDPAPARRRARKG